MFIPVGLFDPMILSIDRYQEGNVSEKKLFAVSCSVDRLGSEAQFLKSLFAFMCMSARKRNPNGWLTNPRVTGSNFAGSNHLCLGTLIRHIID